MRKILLTLLLVGAVVCYLIGTRSGAIALVALGALLELAFWVGLIGDSDEQML